MSKKGRKTLRLRKKENYNYLSVAKDWHLTVDIDTSLKIHSEICQTNLRPDLTMVSKKTKQLV